jgi:hypothetical protein
MSSSLKTWNSSSPSSTLLPPYSGSITLSPTETDCSSTRVSDQECRGRLSTRQALGYRIASFRRWTIERRPPIHTTTRVPANCDRRDVDTRGRSVDRRVVGRQGRASTVRGFTMGMTVPVVLNLPGPTATTVASFIFGSADSGSMIPPADLVMATARCTSTRSKRGLNLEACRRRVVVSVSPKWPTYCSITNAS